jgi:YgiT-type zinc finger domain-containing protein
VNDDGHICPLCGGVKKAGTTLFSADTGSSVVVVRDVHAWVCNQCGEEWIPNDIANKLEKIVEEAREKRLQVEVTVLGETSEQ